MKAIQKTGVMLNISFSEIAEENEKTFNKKYEAKKKLLETISCYITEFNSYLTIFKDIFEKEHKKMIHNRLILLEQAHEKVKKDINLTKNESFEIEKCLILIKKLKKIEKFHDVAIKIHLKTGNRLALVFKKIEIDTKNYLNKEIK